VFRTLLRTLRDCGLDGVRLVISDAHAGLKAAIARVFAANGETPARDALEQMGAARSGQGHSLIVNACCFTKPHVADQVGAMGWSGANCHSQRQRRITIMKRLATALALSTALLGVGAQEASADEPTAVEFDEEFADLNPCTGSLDTFHILNQSRDHIGHANAFVGIVERTGYTASGFEIVNGRATFVDNNNGIKLSISDQWIQPDTGQRLHVTYILKLDADFNTVVDHFSSRCLWAD